MTNDPLAPFGWAPARAGLFLDFDGVLADIAPTPESAIIRPGLSDLLFGLQERLGRVAVVSGRPVGFLARMVPAGVDLVGLYGLESRTAGAHHTLHEAEEWRAPIREIVEAAIVEFGSELVEAKGLSLTLHYRGDEQLSGRMESWVREQSDRTGLDARPAKRSFELHPPVRRDKGTAVIELARDLDPVAYLGDDLGDLPAFDGLDELATRGVATLRVAVSSVEAPPILLRRADHVVEGPAGAEALLRSLLALVSG
jgi:trehalose 6-phosphate phosphatase